MKRLPKINQVNSDTFNLSISDLMAGLLAIFVLVLCYFILKKNKRGSISANQASFFKNINDKLSVKKYIDLMQTATDFRFNVFDMMSSLVYARLVHPCWKIFLIRCRKTRSFC